MLLLNGWILYKYNNTFVYSIQFIEFIYGHNLINKGVMDANKPLLA